MREALSEFGLDPDAIGAAARARASLLAYVELHIEQGPVLEPKICRSAWSPRSTAATAFAVELTGTAGHAGTVPMRLRQDALAAAAECVLAVELLAAASPIWWAPWARSRRCRVRST